VCLKATGGFTNCGVFGYPGSRDEKRWLADKEFEMAILELRIPLLHHQSPNLDYASHYWIINLLI
jgi:hypothetical protein